MIFLYMSKESGMEYPMLQIHGVFIERTQNTTPIMYRNEGKLSIEISEHHHH